MRASGTASGVFFQACQQWLAGWHTASVQPTIPLAVCSMRHSHLWWASTTCGQPRHTNTHLISPCPPPHTPPPLPTAPFSDYGLVAAMCASLGNVRFEGVS